MALSDNIFEIDPCLYKAAVEGDIEPFNKIKQDLHLIVTPIKSTILHIHITSVRQILKSTEFVKNILDKCPSLLLQVNANGDTPLHLAAKRGNSATVEALIESAKADQHVIEPESGVEAVKQMMRMKNNEGNTALHEAVRTGQLNVVKLLAKEDPEFSYSANHFGETPLYIAAAGRSTGIVAEMFDTFKSVAHEGPHGKTALHAAVMSNDLDLVNAKDVKGNTPLHALAASRWNSYDYIVEEVRGEILVFNHQNDSADDIVDYGSPELKKEIQELTQVIKPYRRGIVRRLDKWDNETIAAVEKAKESHLVVAALIATVTFAAAFTMPGGYRSEESPDEGTSLLSRKAAFQAFVITDAMAMVLSLFAVFIHFVLSMDTYNFRFLFKYAFFFTTSAMGVMVIAFVTGTYAVLTPSLGLAISTCCIGLSFFFLVLYSIRKSVIVREKTMPVSF